jgi:exonuclease III
MISKNMIHLCSLNVNGIHGREKRNRLGEWIKTQKCSIAFSQEAYLEENIGNEIKNKTNFAIYFCNGTSANRDMGLEYQ